MVSSQMGDKEQRCLQKSEMCLKFLECEMVVGGWYILQVHAGSYVNIKELGFTVSDQIFYSEDVT